MNYILPRLPNANDFEELVRDIFSVKLKNPNLQRYGRNGQKQQGIDIVGIVGRDYSANSGAVIQCKNQVNSITDEKLCSEIDSELVEFDKSPFKENNYYFVTSADNSTAVLNHVKKINETRKSEAKSSVEVIFWDDISRDLIANQKIFHKYYGNILQIEAPRSLDIVDNNLNSRTTLRVKLSEFDTLEKAKQSIAKLKDVCVANLGSNYQKVDPYNLYLGLTTHAGINFDQRTDLDIDASEFFINADDLDEKYQKMILCLNNMANVLSDSFFSNHLTILSDLQINFSLLLGRVFRKHRLKLYIMFDGSFLTTESKEVNCYPSQVVENHLINQSTTQTPEDLVFILNMAKRTDITQAVVKHTNSWSESFISRSYGIANGNNLENSAHALAIAEDIRLKIHEFQDTRLGLKRLHLFIAAPKPLAMLIGHRLNTLNTEIHMYFFNPDRTGYLKTGVLKNNTF
jgi:hypothetical protein